MTGHDFLSGFIRSDSEIEEYGLSKVCRWVMHINVLLRLL